MVTVLKIQTLFLIPIHLIHLSIYTSFVVRKGVRHN